MKIEQEVLLDSAAHSPQLGLKIQVAHPHQAHPLLAAALHRPERLVWRQVLRPDVSLPGRALRRAL